MRWLLGLLARFLDWLKSVWSLVGPDDGIASQVAGSGGDTRELRIESPAGTDASAGLTSIDCQQALLEEHGIRPMGDPRATSDRRNRTQPGGAAGIPEMADGVFAGTNQAVGPGRGTRPLAPGERLWVDGPGAVADAWDHPHLRGWRPGEPFASVQAYRAFLHLYHDRHRDALIRHFQAEPLFPYAKRMWRPGAEHRAGNLELLQAVADRTAKLMGALYDFDPAPLGARAALPGAFIATYDPATNAILVADRHLGGSLADLMDTLAHEQVHAFHHATIARLDDPGLAPERYSLGLYWLAEERRRTPGPCVHLGTEYHAYDVGRAVGRAIKALPAWQPD